jgi:hypothetical protein
MKQILCKSLYIFHTTLLIILQEELHTLILTFTTHPLVFYPLAFFKSINVRYGVFFLHTTSVSSFRGKTLRFRCGRQEKFGALSITWFRFIHTSKHTICTIPLNLLKYTFRHLINKNMYIYVYEQPHITPLIIYKLLSIRSKKHTFISYTGYLGQSDRPANLLTWLKQKHSIISSHTGDRKSVV